jgi:hypothetical protein
MFQSMVIIFRHGICSRMLVLWGLREFPPMPPKAPKQHLGVLGKKRLRLEPPSVVGANCGPITRTTFLCWSHRVGVQRGAPITRDMRKKPCRGVLVARQRHSCRPLSLLVLAVVFDPHRHRPRIDTSKTRRLMLELHDPSYRPVGGCSSCHITRAAYHTNTLPIA